LTQLNKPERRMSGKVFIILLVAGAIVGVALVGASIYLNAAPSGTASMTGILFISTSGSLGGPGSSQAATATYNVTLKAVSGTGTMNLTLIGKSADLLQQHEFLLTGFSVSPNNLTMSFGGASVNLAWINNGTVWKSLNETYIAAAGPSAPRDQLRGVISPSDFPGASSTDYVVLSLSIVSQPSNNIPFEIAPAPSLARLDRLP
jgi:hypothetical protein